MKSSWGTWENERKHWLHFLCKLHLTSAMLKEEFVLSEKSSAIKFSPLLRRCVMNAFSSPFNPADSLPTYQRLSCFWSSWPSQLSKLNSLQHTMFAATTRSIRKHPKTILVSTDQLSRLQIKLAELSIATFSCCCITWICPQSFTTQYYSLSGHSA